MTRRAVLMAVLVALMLAGGAQQAFGWANGGDHGNGIGTHDWILARAIAFAGKDAAWVDRTAAFRASDDPDSYNTSPYYHNFRESGIRPRGALHRLGDTTPRPSSRIGPATTHSRASTLAFCRTTTPTRASLSTRVRTPPTTASSTSSTSTRSTTTSTRPATSRSGCHAETGCRSPTSAPRRSRPASSRALATTPCATASGPRTV